MLSGIGYAMMIFNKARRRSKLKPEAVRTVFLCWHDTIAHCQHCRHMCTKIQTVFMESILHQEIMLIKNVQCVLWDTLWRQGQKAG